MDRVQTLWRQAIARAKAGSGWLLGEVRQVLDIDAFQSASDWRGRLSSISWRRIAVAGSGLAALALAVDSVSG